jgi:tetraacyldisaccharide 4'-kinase
MGRWLERAWYSGSPWLVFLVPLSFLYQGLVQLRRWTYRVGLLPSYALPMPVIVVGNLTVGGTGKTPLVIWLVQRLQHLGYRPGIVARGYGGEAQTWPQQVRPDSDPGAVGDEAVLLARRCRCPMAVGPDRVAAARALAEHSDCNVIVSDDGLQHYALQRSLEIVVIDGVRRFGNGYCLPAGPLREPASRLRSVDLVVANGPGGRLEYPMSLQLGEVRAVSGEAETRPLASFADGPVHAVAGVGNPQRFFAALRQHRLEPIEHAFPDHHRFTKEDLAFGDGYPVLMTEKDAVKCASFAGPDLWYVVGEAQPDARFEQQVLQRLEALGAPSHDVA